MSEYVILYVGPMVICLLAAWGFYSTRSSLTGMLFIIAFIPVMNLLFAILGAALGFSMLMMAPINWVSDKVNEKLGCSDE